MARTDRMDGSSLKAALAQEIDQLLDTVAREVGQAGEDDVIGQSEHQVREALGRFRSQVFERAVQMRIDAAEAAFSPSGEPSGVGASAASQRTSKPGSADGQRRDSRHS